MQKLRKYIVSAMKRTTQMELANFFCNICSIVFYSFVGVKGGYYLIALVMIADAIRFIARGAWYHAPFHDTCHWHNPSKDDFAIAVMGIKVIALCFLVILKLPELFFAEHLGTNLFQGPRSMLWYAVVIASTVEMFRCLLLTMQKHDDEWLAGTNGFIGLPNWISIIRIALSLIMPHLYITQCLGADSNLIATALMVLAIGTDALDGIIARLTHSVTRVGKYLDPLGDKIIFLPNAVAFIWLFYKNSLMTGDRGFMIAVAIFVAIAAMRDALFFGWWFAAGRKIKGGVSASTVDKIRMGCICVWLLSTTISLSLPTSNIGMATLSIVSIIFVAIFSIVSIGVDYKRISTLTS